MSSSSCPVNSPVMPPGSQGSHIHCPPLPQQALHQNSPSPVPSRTPTPHHTPPSIGAQQPPPTAIPAPVPTPPAIPSGPQPQGLHPPSRQTPTPPTAQLPPQVQPSLPTAPSADQVQQQPRSQQSTAASIPTPTAPLLPPQPTTPVSRGWGLPIGVSTGAHCLHTISSLFPSWLSPQIQWNLAVTAFLLFFPVVALSTGGGER